MWGHPLTIYMLRTSIQLYLLSCAGSHGAGGGWVTPGLTDRQTTIHTYMCMNGRKRARKGTLTGLIWFISIKIYKVLLVRNVQTCVNKDNESRHYCFNLLGEFDPSAGKQEKTCRCFGPRVSFKSKWKDKNTRLPGEKQQVSIKKKYQRKRTCWAKINIVPVLMKLWNHWLVDGCGVDTGGPSWDETSLFFIIVAPWWGTG